MREHGWVVSVAHAVAAVGVQDCGRGAQVGGGGDGGVGGAVADAVEDFGRHEGAWVVLVRKLGEDWEVGSLAVEEGAAVAHCDKMLPCILLCSIGNCSTLVETAMDVDWSRP